MISQKIVCVVGMHRSGTSLATRLLALLGIYLGPEEQLVPPASDNPGGFWEFQPFVELNVTILARLGGRAFAPPAFESGWEKKPELEDMRTRARALVSGTFGDVAMWAWKDPRTCLTLPFWQAVVHPTLYVLCVRNPLEVASSIERRDGVLLERSLYLWLLYTRAALAGTAGEPRILVRYDQTMKDPVKHIEELGRFIGVREPDGGHNLVDHAATFVDSRQRHHSMSDSEQARAAVSTVRRGGSLEFALRAYNALVDHGLSDQQELDGLFETALGAVPPWAIPVASSEMHERAAPVSKSST